MGGDCKVTGLPTPVDPTDAVNKAYADSLGGGGPISTLSLPAQTTEPSAPPADTGVLYARNIAGRTMPKWMGPSGVDYALQPHFGFTSVSMWKGGATTTATTFAAQVGAMPYTSASPTAPTIPTPGVGVLKTSTYRSVISSGATAGGIAYIRANTGRIWRGNVANLGGFLVAHRFGLASTQSGMRAFIGIQDQVANPTNVDPTTATAPGKIGLAINANTGNWNLVHNTSGSAPTVIPLGTDFPVNTSDLLELVLFAKPFDSVIYYQVRNLTTGAVATGTLSSNLPGTNVLMIPILWITNNATAAAANMDFVSTYVETDT